MSNLNSPMIERKQFCHILDALGCSCSPPVPGTDTGWLLNPHCLMHRNIPESDEPSPPYIAPDWSEDQRHEAARVWRAQADEIGLNDPARADLLNSWADKLHKDCE